MTYLNYWERKGSKIGREEGIRSVLKTLIQEKFGQTPDWERLEQAEPTTLELWTRAILHKNSLEEVFSS